MKVYCPVCRKLVPWENNPHRPFCGAECKQRDLGNWATERYRIASEDEPEADATAKKGTDGTGEKPEGG